MSAPGHMSRSRAERFAKYTLAFVYPGDYSRFQKAHANDQVSPHTVRTRALSDLRVAYPGMYEVAYSYSLPIIRRQTGDYPVSHRLGRTEENECPSSESQDRTGSSAAM